MPTYNFAGSIAEGDDYTASQEVISYDGTAHTVAGTAKANTDFVPIDLDVAGEGTFEYTLETVNDDIYEGDEVFYIDYDVDVVTEFQGELTDTNLNGRITITIDDEDDRPTLSMETVSVAEGNGEVTQYVKITASNAASHDYTINISAGAGGTASAGVDFSIDDTSIVMQALETEVLIPITVFGDGYKEPNETVNLIATSTVAGNAQATFTIQNDDQDPPPTLSMETVAVAEGDSKVTHYVKITASKSAAQDYTINIAAGAGGTASIGKDFSIGDTSIVMHALETEVLIPINVFGDGYKEPNETVNLVATSTVAGNAQATFTIQNDDEEERPTLSMETVAVAEGDSVVTHYVKITASNAAAQNYTINISAGGTASEGSDFSIDDTSIVMQALQTEVLIPITVFGDDDEEPNETVNLTATSTVAGNAQATFTIQNDDEGAAPTLSMETVAVAEGDSEVTHYVKITASKAAAQNYTIDISTGGTASEGSDFSIDDTSIVMQALQTEVLIPITIFGDEDEEPNETINLIATSTVAGDAQATFTIQDDDEGGGSPSEGPIVTVSVGGGYAFEGAYTTLNYTVSESVAYAIDVTIDVPQQNSSQAVDYTFRIPASTTAGSKTLVLLGLTDDQREQIKTFGVTYSAVPVTGDDVVFVGSEGSITAPLQIQLADELLYNLEHPNTVSDLFETVEAARALLLSVAGEVFGNDAIHTSDPLLDAADIAAGNAKLLVALARAADLLDLSEEATAIYDTLSAALDDAAGTENRFDAAKAAYVDLLNLVAAADFASPGGSSTLGAALSALELDDVLIPTLEGAALTIDAVLAYSTVEADVEDALGDQYGEGGLPAAGVAVTFIDVPGVEGANPYVASGANDAYIVDDAGDQTTEGGPEGGYDLVVASVDYTIGDGIEALRLTGEAVSGTGNGLANLILGNELANTISGGDGNDTLGGGEGDDTFDAGSGDNVVLGGEGTDTIVFDLTREELSVNLLSDGKAYVEKPDDGGIDILVDVERVDVTDGALLYGLDSENLSFAYRIYAAAYGRTPDEAGLLFWTDVLDDRGEGPPTPEDKEYIASFFLTANEYIDIYGENPTNEEYINKLYQNVLHREADQAGYDFWLGVLSSGQGKDDMLIWFTDSEENLQNTAPDLDNGVWVL